MTANNLTTHAWTQRRARWQQRLPYPCFRCGQLIQPWDTWDLDHRTPRALGGSNADTAPSHTTCNRKAGGELAKQLATIGAQEARRFLSAGDAGVTDRKSVV